MSEQIKLVLGVEVKGQRQLKDLDRQLKDLDKQFNKISKDTTKTSSGFGKVSKSVKLASVAIGSSIAAVALLGVGFVKLSSAMIKVNDTYKLIEGRIGLTTKSHEELNTVMGKLYNVAQDSRSSMQATAEVYSRFAQATKGQGIESQELINITSTLNKAFTISGATAAESSAAMIQLSQAFSSGVLRGDELNSVMESGGRVIDLLTDSMGVTRGELRELASDGKVTSDVMRKAFSEGFTTINTDFEKLPTTVAQVMVKFRNLFESIMVEGDKAAGGTDGIVESLNDLFENVEQNREAFSNLFSFIINSTGNVISALGGVLDAVFSLKEQADVRLEVKAVGVGEFIDLTNKSASELDTLIFKLNESKDANQKFVDAAVWHGKAYKKSVEAIVHDTKQITLVQEAQSKIRLAITNDELDKKYIAHSAYTKKIGDNLRDFAAAERKLSPESKAKEAIKSLEEQAEAACEANKKVLSCVEQKYIAEQKIKDDQIKKDKTDRDNALKQEGDYNKKRISLTSATIKKIGKNDKDYYKNLKKDLKNHIKDLKNAGVDELVIARYVQSEESKINKERLINEQETVRKKILSSGTFFDGVKLGYDDLLSKEIEWGQKGFDVFNQFAKDSTDALSSNLFDVITGDFSTLGEAWDGLWKGMLKGLVDVLAQMAIQYAASKVTSWISKFFHDGTFEVMRNDEGLAILQQGEMVIPAAQAEIIRQLMGGNPDYISGGSGSGGRPSQGGIGHDVAGFAQTQSGLGVTTSGAQSLAMGGLSMAAGTAAGMGAGMTFESALNSSVNGGFSGFITDTITQQGLGFLGINTSVQDAPGFDTGLGFIDGMLDDVVGKITSPTTNIAGISSNIGSVLGGVFGGPMGAAVGGIAGGFLGDLAMDGLDMRSFETVRDALEDNRGVVGGRQAAGAMEAMGVNLGNQVEVAAGLAVVDAQNALSAAASVSSANTIGHADFGLNVLGEYESLGVGFGVGHLAAERGALSNAIDGLENARTGIDSMDAMESANDSQAESMEGLGFGLNDTYGFDFDDEMESMESAIDALDSMGSSGGFGDMPGEEGYRFGGISTGSSSGHMELLHGTEAVVPLPNGRSIPVDIKSENDDDDESYNVVISIKELTRTTERVIDELKRMKMTTDASLYEVVKHTRKTSSVLNRWDLNGLPEERNLS